MDKKLLVLLFTILVVVVVAVVVVVSIQACRKPTTNENYIGSRIAVYSGNFGNYRNELSRRGLDDGYFDPAIDYYLYTDREIHSKKWKVIVLDNDSTPPGGADTMDRHRWASKHIKFILPDELKKYDIVIWKDTKICPLHVKYDNIIKLFEKYPGKSVFLQRFPKTGRPASAAGSGTYFETTQEELTETIKIGLENKASGRKFLNKIKSFTSPLKLSDLCNFARTTDKKTNKAFEHVFDTLRKYKLKRDQNAFIWALHDKGYPIDRIENLEIKYGKLGDN